MRTVTRVHDWVLNAMKLCSQAVIFGIFVLIVVDIGVTILAGHAEFLGIDDLGLAPWDMTFGLVEYGLLWFTMLAAPWLAQPVCVVKMRSTLIPIPLVMFAVGRA